MSARRALGATLLLLTLASACSPSDASSPPTPSSDAAATTSPSAAPLSGRYVAIGDSYTAGPGISPLDPDSGLCLRSESNVATLLATQLATQLVDVSCSGATTESATQGVSGLAGDLPPQLDALTPETDLVTVQLGGNDGGLFQSLLQSCAQDATSCAQFVDGRAPALLTATTDRVAEVLGTVASKSPDATVILVGYLRLSPESGTCDELGIQAQAQDTVRTAESALDDALAAAAERADVPFVSMRSASRGHDACAGTDAWTNGGTVAGGDGIVFHPRSAGMQAVADAVARTIA